MSSTDESGVSSTNIMHREDNLMPQIASMKNLELASKKARKGKKCRSAIRRFDKHHEENLLDLQNWFRTGTYKTSQYTTFTINDPKERTIMRLPFFPDRIAHHALMNVLEPIFVKRLIPQTFACIKGRGIHAGVKAIQKALFNKKGTKYCLKLDVRHYYPSVNHEILKAKVAKIIKDPRVLVIINEIIDSADGLPIGNYLSQYLANVYLNDFDHWVKEVLHVKYYFRYVDDMVFLSDSKEELWAIFKKVQEYLGVELKLEVKKNYQVFPVDARGIDFLGYVFYHSHTKIRKRLKKNIQRKIATFVAQGLSAKEIHRKLGSYQGWFNYAKCKHLIQTLNNKAHGNIFQSKTRKGRAVRQQKPVSPLQHYRSPRLYCRWRARWREVRVR